MRHLRHFISASALLFLVSSSLYAQTAGKLIGQIVDATSASVPNAKITAQNAATGQSRTINTDSSGSYAINDLPIGSYKVTAEHVGFATIQKTGIGISGAL